MFALTGARVLDGHSFLEGHAVVIDGGRIHSVAPDSSLGRIDRVDLAGGLLAPGFVDVQVNGGGGVLFNENPTVDAVRHIFESHRKYGTVFMLPTVITDHPDVLARAIAAAPGGIHIEGPFLDPARKGAHEAQFIRAMTNADVEQIASARCEVKMLTVAPNKVSPETIRELGKRGVLVSLGHSDATYEEASAAKARAYTHLYNAMSQMTGRAPGMVGAAFTDAAAFASVIADGHHAHDAALLAAVAIKGPAKIMLITDAMPSAAGGPDHFMLQGRRVTRAKGRLTLEDGTLAGSDLTMDQAVRYCVNRLGVPVADALRMASATPAAFLGKARQLGRIRPGYLASLVHLDDDLRVLRTWVEGQ
jgi:N-acetylglucosamine-6-phosphate deacetylase